MSERPISRREALHIGAVGSIAGLSGCLTDRLPSGIGLGGSNQYRNWLTSPRTLEVDHYLAGYFAPSVLHDDRHEFNREFYGDIRDLDEQFPGVRFEELDDLIVNSGAGVFVGEGDIDLDRVSSRVRGDNYLRAGEYNGYEIFERDGQSAIGIGDSGIIHVPAYRDRASRIVEVVIDTHAGDVRRYHDVSSSFEELTGAIGGGDVVVARTHESHDESDPEAGRFRNRVGFGASIDVEGETSDVSIGHVFLSDRDVESRNVERWIDAHRTFSNLYEVEVEEDERVAVVTGSMDTRDIDSGIFS